MMSSQRHKLVWKFVTNSALPLLQDGCDFVCRSRNRDEYRATRGVVAETLEEEPEERDDHLLPM